MLITDIIVEDRIRKDYGDLKPLIESIRSFGVIQPIVLTGDPPRLVAGGRRLAAMKQLGFTELTHGKEFVWLDEANDDPYRRSAVELEENLRRQDLTWQEQVLGKKKLLQLMEEMHGKQQMGRQVDGFGVRKLASLLGEDPGGTSKDLAIAEMVQAVPQLINAPTKAAVVRKFKMLGRILDLQSEGKAKQGEQSWELYEMDCLQAAPLIPSHSVDFIYTDLPFGVNLGDLRHHQRAEYSDSREDIVAKLPDIARESFRVLKDNSFAVFFFGFNYYVDLVTALLVAGFTVNKVPFIWHKTTAPSVTQNPYLMLAIQYDPAIVCHKGSPQFVKPGRGNLVSIPPVANKLYVAQQPVELVKFFLETMTLPGSTVLDWMCGSGTTGVAAHEMGRFSILCEKNPLAITITKSRLAAL